MGLNGFGPRSNAYTDSIRGCEALCSGTIKTACSCAACFETDACDSKCSALDRCIVRDPMGKPTMSEAVGASCRDPAKVPADMKKSTWRSTMMTCESSCAFGRGAVQEPATTAANSARRVAHEYVLPFAARAAASNLRDTTSRTSRSTWPNWGTRARCYAKTET